MTVKQLQKQFVAYKNVERKMNKQKCKLYNMYTAILREYAIKRDTKAFDAMAKDMVSDLGEAYELTILSIRDLYTLPCNLLD